MTTMIQNQVQRSTHTVKTLRTTILGGRSVTIVTTNTHVTHRLVAPTALPLEKFKAYIQKTPVDDNADFEEKAQAETRLAVALLAKFEQFGFAHKDTLAAVADLADAYEAQGFSDEAGKMRSAVATCLA
ncbi:hypothetical protein BC830DRAFT_1221576 [Chytriomyces sp. MP71]|nr:hypothetical protein BC830DRAFT_1221576 [Chytriomyces sp. MP71]